MDATNPPITQTYVLIIGVGNYPQLPTIANTVNDAKDLFALLTDPQRGNIASYNARLLVDKQATAVEIDNKLNWLASTATVADTVIIYFSGHGFSRAGGKDAGSYICPYDTETANLRATAFSSEELKKSLERINAGWLALFVDACYSGGSVDASTQPGLTRADYQSLLMGHGRALYASSQSGEVSYIMPDSRNSLFTACLLEVFGGKGVADTQPNITTTAVANYLNDEVTRRNANQHPYALLAGNFTLMPNPLYKADGSGLITAPPAITHAALPPLIGQPSGETIKPSKPSIVKIGTQNNVTGTQNNVGGNQYNSGGDQFINNRNVSTGSGGITDYGGVQGGVHNYGGVQGGVNNNYGNQTNTNNTNSGNTNIHTGNVSSSGGSNVAIGSGINQTSGGNQPSAAGPTYNQAVLYQAMKGLSDDDLQAICLLVATISATDLDYTTMASASPTVRPLLLIQACTKLHCLTALIETLNSDANWRTTLDGNYTGWHNWAIQQDAK